MLKILRKWPISESPTSVVVGNEVVTVRPFQIVIQVSLVFDQELSKPFPAILDTGHNHNFSIQEEQLQRWTGRGLSGCSRHGTILVNRLEVPLIVASLAIHRNQTGATTLLDKPIVLDLPEGISVYPRSTPLAPRLPLLGLRGLIRNQMAITIDPDCISLSRKKLARQN